MATDKSNKSQVYFFILLTVIGCVLACSSIITNDYLKLIIVMGTLCFGLYGIMKALSNSSNNPEDITSEDNN